MAGPSGQTARYKWPYPTPDDNNDVPRDVGALANAIEPTVFGQVPPGCVMMWPAASAPSGWYICNGTLVTAAANPGLDSIFGHDAGGNVKLPDYQNVVMYGASSAHPIGERGGVETVALSNAQLPTHSHPITDKAHVHATDAQGWHTHGGATTGSDRGLGHSHSYGRFASAQPANLATGTNWNVNTGGPIGYSTGGEGAPDHLHYINGDGSHGHNIDARYTGINATESIGSGQTHSNMPPYVSINHIIKGG